MITIDKLLYLIREAHESSWINVDSVEKLGNTFYVRTDEELGEISEEINSLKEDLEGEVQWRKELQKEVEDKTREIAELELISRKFEEEGVSVKGLFSENKDLKKKINEWYEHSLDLERKIEKLQARKNKATIERDLKTGQFVAEFQGVKYNLVKQ